MKKFACLTGLMMLAALTPLLADPTPGEVELTRAVIQTQKKAIVEANMNIDTTTASKFWPLYNDYQEAMRKVNDGSVKLLEDYAGNWLQLSDEKANSLLDQMFKLQKEKISVRQKYARKFRKSLPAKVVSRFFQIENKLDAVINFELADKVPLVH